MKKIVTKLSFKHHLLVYSSHDFSCCIAAYKQINNEIELSNQFCIKELNLFDTCMDDTHTNFDTKILQQLLHKSIVFTQ